MKIVASFIFAAILVTAYLADGRPNGSRDLAKKLEAEKIHELKRMLQYLSGNKRIESDSEERSEERVGQDDACTPCFNVIIDPVYNFCIDNHNLLGGVMDIF